ncbi:MAG: hypothetical protein K9H65_06360 [Bacteroidales bacterium]|nr:hypothetical protein [Bacteroidales bacterium]
MENLWVQISTVFIVGATGIWKGVPAGLAINAHPVITAGFTALGSIAVVLALFFSGKSFKEWILKRYGREKLKKKEGRFSRLMDRYGVAGIGLIGCGVIGPILSTLFGLILVRETKRLLVSLIAGIILWSSLLTVLGEMGVRLFQNFL